MLVLEGSIRVQMVSESGREIVLYRVETGQSCILTTSCLMAHKSYMAEAVTETTVRAVSIPMEFFQEALAESQPFREFVFASYGERIADLIMLVDAVAFGRMDARLAECLLKKAALQGWIDITHQELATELGTAREVISRLLKEFERSGRVNLHRGRVEIVDMGALEKINNSSV